MAKAELSDKQRAFCQEYIVDGNATQAAIRAGYSPRTAQEQSSRLLSKAIVSDHVARLQEKRLEAAQIDAQYVLNGIKKVAEDSAEIVVDDNGRRGAKNPSAALKGYELLGKHLVMFTDKVQHTGDVKLSGFEYCGK